MSDVLTIEEACAILRVAKPTVLDWREKGIAPPFFKYSEGRTSPLFILREDLEKWIANQAKQASASAK